MTLTLSEQQAWWDGAATANAANAVLSNRAHWSMDEFFETGKAWWADHRAFALRSGADLFGRRALDFGCGLGSMSRAISEHFAFVVGIDISAEMLARAEATDRILYARIDTYPFPFNPQSFDFCHSSIVIQHIPMPHSAAYIGELFRMSSKYVLFDAPTRHESGPLTGIFITPEAAIMEVARDRGFKMLAKESYGGTADEQYRFLFIRT